MVTRDVPPAIRRWQRGWGVPAWLLGRGGRQGEISPCGTHSRASPLPRSHLCYNPPQHPWVPCICKHSLFLACWVLGEYVGKTHCRASSGNSDPPTHPYPSHNLLAPVMPCSPRRPSGRALGWCRRLRTTVTSLSFLSFLSFFFPRNHLPACHTPCLPLGCF